MQLPRIRQKSFVAVEGVVNAYVQIYFVYKITLISSVCSYLIIVG